MNVAVGDRIPNAVLKYMGSDGPLDVREISIEDLCNGKKVVLFGLPGAYTPVCSAEHLPGFVEQSRTLKARGVDNIVCVSANDPFVMRAWAQDQGAEDDVMMLSDDKCEFADSLGLALDLSDFGLGKRSERFVMVIDDGVISTLNVEESILACNVSSSEALLSVL